MYERMKNLLGGGAKHTLSSDMLIDCVQKRSLSELGDALRIYVLHDPSDIRKPSSQDMEYLGKVKGLNKAVINGYKSANCVAIDPTNQGVSLLCHELYSENHPNYISQKRLADSENLTAVEQELVSNGKHVNSQVLVLRQITESSALLKKDSPNRQVTHILDREFDDSTIFRAISALKDEFVVRAILSRVSSEGETKLTPKTGRVSKQLHYPKLVDKSLKFQASYFIPKLTIKNKTYSGVTAMLEWEDLVIEEKTYKVVKITLKQGEKALFQHHMLLITNRKVETAEDAKNVYHAYILRFKIEVVFKFIKQNLGWESFQIRNFEAIKNLLALAFFLVAYFKELEDELKKHDLALFLCKLAHSKGKISIFFLLLGLEKLAHFQEVQKWMTENDISPQQISDMLQEAGLLQT